MAKKIKNKPSFNCDTNGSIMVTAALRYALGRMTYVPGAVQDWIKTHWDDLDSNTKFVVVRDVFEFLYKDYLVKNDAQFLDAIADYDTKEWEKFGIDMFNSLENSERQQIDACIIGTNEKTAWFANYMIPKITEHKNVLES